MNSRIAVSILALALTGGVSFASLRASGGTAHHDPVPAPTAAPSASSAVPPLPPNHPPIGASTRIVPTNETAAIAWGDPAGWQRMPNPNPIRIATYGVPGVGGQDGAELTVARAGGTTEANIQRWLHEFDEMGRETRTESTVRGMQVTIVETTGTYTSGVMGPRSNRRPGWALLAAIVETPGSHYFFKMLGPKDSVRAARPALDSLIGSIVPISP
jgi:hypothetical protein